MQAAIIENYGSYQEIKIKEHIDIPKIKSNEVLVKTKASSINPMDIDTRKGLFKFLAPFTNKNKKPLTGLEFSGVVQETGSNVSQFKSGDEVFGYINLLRGHKTHAQYLTIHKDYIAAKPPALSHIEAASLPVGMITSVRALRDIGKLKKNQSILINGASGGVGVYAVQYAKAMGASVTAVTTSKNFDFVTSLGADHLIDYTNQDMTKICQKFDMVFDVANKSSFEESYPILKTTGTYITTDPFKDITGFIKAHFSSRNSNYLMVLKGSGKDFQHTADLVTKGMIKPVIEKVFPFHKIDQAHHYFETNPRYGKVILDMQN